MSNNAVSHGQRRLATFCARARQRRGWSLKISCTKTNTTRLFISTLRARVRTSRVPNRELLLASKVDRWRRMDAQRATAIDRQQRHAATATRRSLHSCDTKCSIGAMCPTPLVTATRKKNEIIKQETTPSPTRNCIMRASACPTTFATARIAPQAYNNFRVLHQHMIYRNYKIIK